MNRRGFFKLAALATIGIHIPKLPDSFKWKKAASGIYVINPDWVNAPYEVAFLYRIDYYESVILAHTPSFRNFLELSKFPPNMGNTIRELCPTT